MDNAAILKYLLLLLTAPFWWPFVRTLWEDLQKAMREEGGLWGDPPHPRDMEVLLREIAAEDPELVHEPHVLPGERKELDRRRASGRPAGGTAGGPLRRAEPRRGPQRGFR